jgi:hypothetical protein
MYQSCIYEGLIGRGEGAVEMLIPYNNSHKGPCPDDEEKLEILM